MTRLPTFGGEPPSNTCGVGDGARYCQLAAGHDGDHAHLADDLSYVET